MKKLILAAMLSVTAIGSAVAADRPALAVLIDDSAGEVRGRLQPVPLENAFAVAADNGIGAQMFLSGDQLNDPEFLRTAVTIPRPAGMSYAQSLGAGIVGGLIAGIIVQAKVSSDRQKTLLPLQQAMNSERLLQAFSAGLQGGFEADGYSVQQSASVANANGSAALAYLKKDQAPRVVVVAPIDNKLVSISANNATPVLLARLFLYERRDGQNALVKTLDVAYIGNNPPTVAGAVEHWSRDAGSAFLAEVRAGARAMARALTALPATTTSAEPAAKDAPEKEMKIEMLQVAEGIAYARLDDKLILAAPVLASAEEKVRAASLFGNLPAAKPMLPTADGSVAAADSTASTARLHMVGWNDSAEQTMRRYYRVDAKQGERCEKGGKVKLKKPYFNPKDEAVAVSNGYILPATGPLTLTLSYMDGRFAQTRACSLEIIFKPAPGKQYQAEIAVDQNVTRCEARLLEIADDQSMTPVAFDKPARTCDGRLSNGEAQWSSF